MTTANEPLDDSAYYVEDEELEEEKPSRGGSLAPRPPMWDAPLAPGLEGIVLAVIAAAFLFLLTVGMGRTGFEGRDERRYAAISKEIELGRKFFVMHQLGRLYPDKPPLFFYAQRFAMWILGNEVSPLAARLPLAAFSLMALGFGYLFLRQLFGPRAALVSLLVLGLSFRFFWASRWARLDVPMCAFTFACWWASARLLFPRAGERRAGAGWAYFAWVMAAFAVLTKGVGLVVWLGSLLAWAAWTRDWSVVRRHRPLAGFALMLAIVLLWFLPAALLGGAAYIGPMIGTHVVERALGEVRHGEPFYYFWGKVFYDNAPAGLLLPLTIWWLWTTRHARERTGPIAFLAVTVLFGLVFFSLPKGKRSLYILPLYLAVAGLVGQCLVAALRDPKGLLAAALRGHLVALGGLAALAGLAGLPFLPKIVSPEVSVPHWSTCALLGLAAALLGAGMAAAAWRRWLGVSLLAGAALVGGAYGVAFGIFYPPNRSDWVPREIARSIAEQSALEPRIALLGDGDRYATYIWPQVHQFFDSEVDPFRAFVEARTGRDTFVIASEETFVDNYVRRYGDPGWPILAEWRDAERGYQRVLLFQP